MVFCSFLFCLWCPTAPDHLLKGCFSPTELILHLCQKSVGPSVWGYFWVLYTAPLSVPLPAPTRPDYCGKIMPCYHLDWFLLLYSFSRYFRYSTSLTFHTNFMIILSISTKNFCWDFDRNFVNQFGKNWGLYYIKTSDPHTQYVSPFI